jgi:hypothetical protein
MFTAAMLALNGWMMSSIIDLREFAARGDRFTIQDANGMREYLDRRIAHLEIPPDWFREMVVQNREAIREHEKRLIESERRLLRGAH